ncbi:MAG: hypothetical protein IPI90_14360 [Saprospiraceae bacterium]|nr:hypothetical protein [Candidatus Vicinibacter affinis]
MRTRLTSRGKQVPAATRETSPTTFNTALRAKLYVDAKEEGNLATDPPARQLMTARRMVNASGPSSHCWLYHNGAL